MGNVFSLDIEVATLVKKVATREKSRGRNSYIKRTKMFFRNFEKNPEEVPRSCFLGVA